MEAVVSHAVKFDMYKIIVAMDTGLMWKRETTGKLDMYEKIYRFDVETKRWRREDISTAKPRFKNRCSKTSCCNVEHFFSPASKSSWGKARAEPSAGHIDFFSRNYHVVEPQVGGGHALWLNPGWSWRNDKPV